MLKRMHKETLVAVYKMNGMSQSLIDGYTINHVDKPELVSRLEITYCRPEYRVSYDWSRYDDWHEVIVLISDDL